MALAPGTRIAHYEIVGSLGAGGMGEVYRVRDTKLSREVALKTLRRTLAALNHQHIAQGHGFEEGDATSALVIEEAAR